MGPQSVKGWNGMELVIRPPPPEDGRGGFRIRALRPKSGGWTEKKIQGHTKPLGLRIFLHLELAQKKNCKKNKFSIKIR